jgi:hypothetical protein
MKHTTRSFLIRWAVVVGLAAVLGFGVQRVGAYDFSATDLGAMNSPSYGNPGRTSGERERERAEADQRQAQRNLQQNEDLARQGQRFDSRDYNAPAPFTFSDGAGRSTVCRHGYNNSVVCER